MKNPGGLFLKKKTFFF